MILETLSVALKACGLPEDPKLVVGRPFMFTDGTHTIVGTVTSLVYAGVPTSLALLVSSRQFRGDAISALGYFEGKWFVAPISEKMNFGSFELL